MTLLLKDIDLQFLIQNHLIQNLVHSMFKKKHLNKITQQRNLFKN